MDRAPASPTRDSPSGLARIVAAATVWGTIPVALSYLTRVPALVIVFWRVAISGTALLAYQALRGRGFGEYRRMGVRGLAALSVQGALLALNWVLFFSALKLAGVAIAELLGYVGPVFVAALTPFVLREPFDRRVVLPLVLALAGTIVIVVAGVSGPQHGPNVPLGALMAGCASLTYAFLILNSKRLLPRTSTVALMTAESVTAAVLLLPAALLLTGPTVAHEFGALATLGLVHTVGTGLLFVSGLRRVRADHAAILTYAEPVSAVVFGALLLGQPVTPLTALGGGAVVAAGALVARFGTGFGQEAPTPGV